MAAQEVNLVPETELTSSPARKRAGWIAKISTVILIVYVVLLGALLLIYTLSVKSLSDLRLSRKPIEGKIDQLQDRERLMVALSGKLDALQTITQKQPPFQQIIERLIELQKNDINYNEVSLSSSNKIILSGHAANVTALDQFLGDLTAKEFRQKAFTDIVLQNLSRNDKGQYDYSLRFTYSGSK